MRILRVNRRGHQINISAEPIITPLRNDESKEAKCFAKVTLIKTLNNSINKKQLIITQPPCTAVVKSFAMHTA